MRTPKGILEQACLRVECPLQRADRPKPPFRLRPTPALVFAAVECLRSPV